MNPVPFPYAFPRPGVPVAAALLAASLALPSTGQESADTLLPVAFPVTRYTAIWEDSPFEREVVKPVVNTVPSTFAQSLVLEGLVNDDRRGPVAYVRDNRDNLSLVVTKEPSGTASNPYTVVSAKLSRKPEESKVTITDGKETAEIGFVVASLTQAIAAPAPAPAPARQSRTEKPDKASIRPSTPPGLVAPGAIPPGGAGIDAATPNDEPTSLTPALDKLDSEPRRRRVPLPGN